MSVLLSGVTLKSASVFVIVCGFMWLSPALSHRWIVKKALDLVTFWGRRPVLIAGPVWRVNTDVLDGLVATTKPSIVVTSEERLLKVIEYYALINIYFLCFKIRKKNIFEDFQRFKEGKLVTDSTLKRESMKSANSVRPFKTLQWIFYPQIWWRWCVFCLLH